MHRKIGILGGMSPESTTLYYEHITRTYTARHGDFGYPEVLIYSVNFQQFVDWQHNGQWGDAAAAMSSALNRLHQAGAGFGLIATNTMHIVFDAVQAAVAMPLVSIIDATGEALRAAGLQTAGLLGTVFTMREPFFREGLLRHGIRPIIPDLQDQERINHIIYRELCRGEIRQQSRQVFLDIIGRLQQAGAQGVILGCTEIPLLVRPGDCPLPLFNTSLLHAERALDLATQDSGVP
jgi:aspartate racemase